MKIITILTTLYLRKPLYVDLMQRIVDNLDCGKHNNDHFNSYKCDCNVMPINGQRRMISFYSTFITPSIDSKLSSSSNLRGCDERSLISSCMILQLEDLCHLPVSALVELDERSFRRSWYLHHFALRKILLQ